MSKLARLTILSFVLAVVITAGTYFINNSSKVTFMQAFGECALPSSEAPLPTEIQKEARRGFPVTYERKVPHQQNEGICGLSLVYTTEFSYIGVGLDVLIWWIICFIVFRLSKL